jgi:small conductance mechanosensitive channel
MPAKDLILDLVIRYGFQVLGALFIVAAGLLLARWLGTLVDQRLTARAMEPPMRMLIVRALRIVVMLFALVVALDKFGFQIAPLVAGIGVAGLGIGIALQGVLSNVMAGLTIIFTKPFHVGEEIEIVGAHGEVATIELFSTTLLHPDRSRVVIPNRKIVGEILHNYGTMRQLRLTVAIPTTADHAAALAAARDIVARDPRVLKDPAPVIGIAGLSQDFMTVAVQPWAKVRDVGALEAELYRSLLENLRARGVTVGRPPTEVRLLNGSSRPS